MPGAKLKPLYLSKNLEDLKPKYDVQPSKMKPKMLLNTAEKIFEKAEKEELNGDEELSYVLFMKYLTVLNIVQKTDECRKDQSLLNKKKFEQALNRAHKLSESLQQRYKLISHQATLDAELLEQEKKHAEEEIKKRLEKSSLGTDIISNEPQMSASFADVSPVSLSCLKLYDLVVKSKVQVLILDARPALCYARSHMTLPRCINIADDLIQAGVSAGSLSKLLSRESSEIFDQRSFVTLVVLLDWSTTHKTLSPGSKLYILKNILLKWDTKIIYKVEPLILEGGYYDWVSHFPALTTEPLTKPPKSDQMDDLLNLDMIEYPTINEIVPDYQSKPASISNIPYAKTNNDVSSSRPGVDRGLKAAAIKTYEEKMREYTDLLEANEKGADCSLVIERDRLETEKSWEETRKRREMEAEGEMRQILQEKEDMLLKNISILEEKQQLKEEENKALRDQLQDYKRKEMNESNRLADIHKIYSEAQVNAKILQAEAKAKALSREREEMAIQRNKKLQEDRQKRKQEEIRRAEQEQQDRLKQKKTNGSEYYKPLQTEPQPGSSIMKRSHSSPNIAQMLDDEDLTAKHKAPQFDRAIKPLQKPKSSDLNAARQREFNMVWGNKGSGLTGLKNLGNTCYMNSIIQCISNTIFLTKYFCNGEYREHVNHENKTKGAIVEEFAAVVRNLWNKQYRLISCPDLKNVVGRHKEEFRGSQQQDSHEFLFFLINWLHDDLNNRTINSKVDKTLPQYTDSDKHWAEFRRCNESIILDLFYGQQKSTIECFICNKQSSTYEPFNHISLPLPNTNSKCSFDDCLKLYLKGERISGWNCPSCKEARDAVKKFDICKLPPVLVIHLKRFYHDGWSRKKQTMVEFPSELKMPSRRSHTSGGVMEEETSYNLYGVSNHYGTMEGGHYTAYCKNYVFSKWYKFDDHEVSEISESDVKSSAAYILFYFSENNKLSVPSGR